jgi:hypothetical protein
MRPLVERVKICSAFYFERSPTEREVVSSDFAGSFVDIGVEHARPWQEFGGLAELRHIYYSLPTIFSALAPPCGKSGERHGA